MSYKGGNAAYDQKKMSDDFGIIILRSHDTKSAGKGPIDGQGAVNHVLYVNEVALKVEEGGLGDDALNLELVVQRMNRDLTFPQKFWTGDHRTGPRMWYNFTADMYDEFRSNTPYIETLVTQKSD